MRVSIICITILCAFANVLFSQDVLYTINGEKIKAKVLEINTVDIKYKDFSNLEGPLYIVSKNDIVLINYSNGTSQIINQNPPTVLPVKPEYKVEEPKKTPDVKKQPLNLYYLNNNMLSINALALANGDITLIYDREFANNHMSFSLLGGYNFNSRMGALNLYIADSHEKAKKNYDVGAAFNFMPNNTKRVQYFVGLLAKYMSYSYDEVVNTVNNQQIYQKSNGSQFAVMVTNGWIYRISPSFNFKLFGSFGFPVNNPVNNSYEGLPKVYLGYCFGYRF